MMKNLAPPSVSNMYEKISLMSEIIGYVLSDPSICPLIILFLKKKMNKITNHNLFLLKDFTDFM